MSIIVLQDLHARESRLIHSMELLCDEELEASDVTRTEVSG